MKEIENSLYNEGYKLIAGVDEAGRGPLAGPVCAAAVILPEDLVIEGINDSKKLTEKKREQLFDVIIDSAIAYSIEFADQTYLPCINKVPLRIIGDSQRRVYVYLTTEE